MQCAQTRKNSTYAGAGRFEKPAPDPRPTRPEAHQSLTGRKTGEEVPLTGLFFLPNHFDTGNGAPPQFAVLLFQSPSGERKITTFAFAASSFSMSLNSNE